MTDLSAISTVLSSIKAATDIAKIVRESGLTLEKAEYKLKLAELVEKLADAKLQISSVQEIIDERDKKIQELERAAVIKGNLSFQPPYYWLTEVSGKTGPYCQQCYDSTAKLIRLTGFNNGYWECKTCKNNYTDSNYHPEILSIPSRSDHDDY